jgi:hypothetical protein
MPFIPGLQMLRGVGHGAALHSIGRKRAGRRSGTGTDGAPLDCQGLRATHDTREGGYKQNHICASRGHESRVENV